MIEAKFMKAMSATPNTQPQNQVTNKEAEIKPIAGPITNKMCSVDPRVNNRPSPSSNKKTVLMLGNESDKTVMIFWVDENGGQTYLNELGPGNKMSAETFYGNVFRLIDAKTTNVL